MAKQKQEVIFSGIPPELWKQFKIYCVQNDKTLKQAFIEMLQEKTGTTAIDVKTKAEPPPPE